MSKKVKMVFLGNSSTGKTSIVYRLLNGGFSNDGESTIGASFATLKHNDIMYEIWDTAGQERYNSLVPMYTRNAEIIIFVFDLTNLETINRFDSYIKDLKNNLDDKFKVIIIGNKMDLFRGELSMVHDIINKKIEFYEHLKDRIVYVDTSAKSGKNIDLLKDIYTNSGFTLLQNSYDIIYGKDNDKLFIGGVDTYSYNESDIDKVMNYFTDNEDISYKIILTHEPDYTDIILSKYKVNLVLAGHSHNGQINIPYVKKLFLPYGSKKYYENYYKVNDTDLYVSSGIGESRINFRLFNKPSIIFYRINKLGA